MLSAGTIRFNTASLEVHCGARLVSLTPIEREILKLFLQNPGKVLSRERILNKVWSVDKDPQTNIVDVYVQTPAPETRDGGRPDRDRARRGLSMRRMRALRDR